MATQDESIRAPLQRRGRGRRGRSRADDNSSANSLSLKTGRSFYNSGEAHEPVNSASGGVPGIWRHGSAWPCYRKRPRSSVNTGNSPAVQFDHGDKPSTWLRERRSSGISQNWISGLTRGTSGVQNGSQLRRTLKLWVDHYNKGRPHSSLGPGIPDRPVDLPQEAPPYIAFPMVAAPPPSPS